MWYVSKYLTFDICMVVGYENGRCVGYHGLLPGYLRDCDGLSRIYWLVTFFVKPEFRGRGYGKRLVQEIQGYGADLVTTGITDAAEKVYRNAGFQALGELTYYHISSGELQSKVSVFEQYDHWEGLNETQRNCEARVVRTIGKHAGNHPEQPTTAPTFLRDLDAQNWMLQHPWVVSLNEAQRDVKNYHFSRVRERFNFYGIEFYAADENQPDGQMTLSVSSRKSKTVVKILDVFFQEPEGFNLAAYTGLKYASTYRAQRLEFPATLNHFYLRQPALEGFIKKKKRLYLFYPGHADSPLAQNAPFMELSYCDGDTAFT